MKKTIFILMSIFTALTVSSCDQVITNETANEVASSDELYATTVSGAEAHKLVSDSNAILLDVRTPDEYNLSHIEGSVLVPLDNLENSVLETLPDTDANVIVYCHSGRRSAIAADIMLDLGYTSVYDLGPMNAWYQ